MLLAELSAMVVMRDGARQICRQGMVKPLLLRSQYVHKMFSVGSFDPSNGDGVRIVTDQFQAVANNSP